MTTIEQGQIPLFNISTKQLHKNPLLTSTAVLKQSQKKKKKNTRRGNHFLPLCSCLKLLTHSICYLIPSSVVNKVHDSPKLHLVTEFIITSSFFLFSEQCKVLLILNERMHAFDDDVIIFIFLVYLRGTWPKAVVCNL